jgi:hypothetical protein
MDISLKYAEFDSASQAYTWMSNLITEKGELVITRGEQTREVLNTAVLIKNPKDRVIPILKFNENFILQEAYDILNENQPRVMHSKEMLEKTMGSSKNIMFFGNEMRQAFSRWSLHRIKTLFENDKYTRKAILDLGNRRPVVHAPCLIYAHFIIRDNKLHMSAETRGTEVSMGFVNDVYFFTVIQEILYGWLLETYPDLELGTFLYKTTSLHYFVDKYGGPLWSNHLLDRGVEMPSDIDKLRYTDFIKEMGLLYYYVDQYMKAQEVENVDAGVITTYKDVLQPRIEDFKSLFFYNWARTLLKIKTV